MIMKQFIIALVLLVSFQSNAQSWDAKFEDAQFQHFTNNYSAYTRDVRRSDGTVFSMDDYELISDRCLSKEGIFRLELSDDQLTIRVYLLEWIDQYTIDWLFTEARPTLDHQLRIHAPVAFSF